MLRSAKMRKLNTALSREGGIIKLSLELYAGGHTYQQIANRFGIPFGTMCYYMRKWRKETRAHVD